MSKHAALAEDAKTKVSSVLLDVQVPQLDRVGGGTHFLKVLTSDPKPLTRNPKNLNIKPTNTPPHAAWKPPAGCGKLAAQQGCRRRATKNWSHGLDLQGTVYGRLKGGQQNSQKHGCQSLCCQSLCFAKTKQSSNADHRPSVDQHSCLEHTRSISQINPKP